MANMMVKQQDSDGWNLQVVSRHKLEEVRLIIKGNIELQYALYKESHTIIGDIFGLNCENPANKDKILNFDICNDAVDPFFSPIIEDVLMIGVFVMDFLESYFIVEVSQRLDVGAAVFLQFKRKII